MLCLLFLMFYECKILNVFFLVCKYNVIFAFTLFLSICILSCLTFVCLLTCTVLILEGFCQSKETFKQKFVLKYRLKEKIQRKGVYVFI